jgi:cytochrome bd-type quinol oxidase subunit 2
MKSLLTKISALLTSLVFVAMVATPGVIFAQETSANNGGSTADIQGSLKQGGCLSTDSSDCEASKDAGGTVNNIIAQVINIFSLVVGVVSVIMIIIGGLKYITSGGDSGNVSGAKNTILYAIVGLVIVALAQVVVHFVLSKVTNDSTNGGGTL